MSKKKVILDAFATNGGTATRDQLKSSLCVNGYVSENTLGKSLDRLMDDGSIVRIERGKYRLNSPIKKTFSAMPTNEVKRIAKRLRERFPFTKFCIMDTSSLLPLMHDIPNTEMIVIQAEKGAENLIADALLNISNRLILRKPTPEMLGDLTQGHNSIVVNTLISQAPTKEIDGIATPTLEKVLVDILCDNEFYYLRGSESYYIYNTALAEYEINTSALLRYAGRRNRSDKVKSIIKYVEENDLG